MKPEATLLYHAGERPGVRFHQPAMSDRMRCAYIEAGWSFNRPTSQDLRHYAAGGAPAIRR